MNEMQNFNDKTTSFNNEERFIKICEHIFNNYNSLFKDDSKFIRNEFKRIDLDNLTNRQKELLLNMNKEYLLINYNIVWERIF
jgi:hypothetical protein